MLKPLKRSVLSAVKLAGGFTRTGSSDWRRRRLLILCYHGIALDDENEYNPSLYLRPDEFEARLTLLSELGCTVLPLDEAIRRLYSGDLPARSTVITFDDGNYDFYAAAWPLLKAHGFPATVYLTTHYCFRRTPVFDVACAYLLWRGRGGALEGAPLGIPGVLDLATPESTDRTRRAILALARDRGLDTAAKDELLATLAAAVGVDYQDFLRRHRFQIMTPEEVSRAAAEGADVQLHTHRHRTPMDRELFVKEIGDNRQRIRTLTGRDPLHFCYPSGFHMPEFLPWLAAEGIGSAVTCDSGLASRHSDPLLLPRVVDQPALAPVEFESWAAGCGAWIPRRPRPMN